MPNEDGSLHVIFNGEIYNYVELAEELRQLGHTFRTRTDTKVILHAYEEWGQECLNSFSGMFAFAIHDARRRRLFLARDRFGIKPLHYWHAGGRLIFASEIKAILEFPEVPRRPDELSVYDYLAFNCYNHTERTFFEGIRSLLPGQCATFDLAASLLARARLFSRPGRLRWPARAVGAILVIAMVAQTAVVPPYVRPMRTLPIPVVAGFEWIKANTAPNARIIYPEFSLTAMTGRPIMWAAIYPRFFLNKPEEDQACILYYMRVDYIAIHPSRFIDKAEPDTEPRGYPISWVRSLRDRPYLTQVYPAEPRRAEEGGEFVLYRVDRDKIPQAWLNTTAQLGFRAADREF